MWRSTRYLCACGLLSGLGLGFGLGIGFGLASGLLGNGLVSGLGSPTARQDTTASRADLSFTFF